MTVLTDRETSFTFQVQADLDGWKDLPAVNIVPSMDIDRAPYCQARIDLAGVDYATILALDPRLDTVSTGERGNVIRFRVLEFDGAGDFRANVLRDNASPALQWSRLPIRSLQYDHLTGDATIYLGGRESILDDRRRIAGNTVDTGATNVLNLVYWSLTDTFSGYSVSADPLAAATSIPAGDRRLMVQGESHSELMEPELQAIGYRLFDYWGKQWYVNHRENPPLLGVSFGYERTLQLSTYTQREGAPANADPIIYEISESFDRAGEYADGVLIKFDMTSFGGTTSYQRSGDGSNTKGRVITWQRSEPAANAANEVASRTKIRGRDLTITGRARLDLSPGQTLRAFLRDDLELTANVRAIEWDVAAGTMSIRAQSGIPEE